MNERPSVTVATRAVDNEIKRMQTVGHLRRTCREIGGVVAGHGEETAEMVAFQNAVERAFNNYCDAVRSPAAALSYTAPDQVRALLTARSAAAQADTGGQQEHHSDASEG